MYIKYLEELISFKSITPDSAGSIEYIKDLLSKNGFNIEVKTFGDGYTEVTNLYAIYGKGRPNICFAGHVDVVPAGDLKIWDSDPFIATHNEDKIYGRGAVDMKGALACALAASLDFIKLHPNSKGAISFLITSDEEGDGKYGTAEMLRHLYKDGIADIDLAIVGEPTSELQIGDTIKIGRRGSINFHLIILGKQGHVAYPKKAANPLPCLTNILYELANYELDKGSEFFQQSNLEITSIDVGNNVTNVIPGEASTRFNIRFNDLHSAESLVNLITELTEKYCNKYRLDYKLNSNSSANSFIQKPVGLIADFVEAVKNSTKIKPDLSTSGGTSDARIIKNYCQVVEFGLLSETAHKINECTKIADLQTLYHVYYNSLIKFLI